ncbi:hypothetical protein [Ghiorsea bivora]|uniref:hypothetical protein n=1 Tax=Ghiorsea bivora TaxID=1485545 RepID=UPI0005712D73|nr:hypothetical protein [Ghiorsea bivora]
MRVFVLTAFFALQLSVFTCGFDIHVHTMVGDDIAQVAQSQGGDATQHQNNDVDHACHIHTSHTLLDFASVTTHEVPLFAFVVEHLWAEPNLKKLQFSIDYPPKTTV